jgi:hypothetical protein
MKKNKYNIDHGVHLPTKMFEKGVSSTVRQLKPGDSFECEIGNRSAAYSSGRFLQFKIAVRKVSSDKIRVWRIK